MSINKVHLQSLLWPVLFFIAGICSSTYDLLPWRGTLAVIVGIALIISTLFYFIRPTPSRFSETHLICNLLFFLSGWGITSFQEKSFQQYAHSLSRNPHPTGIVTEISRYAKMDRFGLQIPTKQWWNPNHHFNINLLEKGSSIRKGQTIRINKPLNPIRSDVIPFTFRAEEYWSLQNTSHDVFLYEASDVHILDSKASNLIDEIRENGLNRIDSLYQDPAQSGILKALLLGQTDGVTKEVKSHFKHAGLLHILAVSGLHVGIVSGLLFFVLFPVKIFYSRPWLHYFFIICALWVYAVLTGMNIPVVRAVILMSFYLTANRLDRQKSKWNIYLWAVLIVLVIHPRSLFSVSFQLSFGAVAAILLFYTHINKWLKTWMGQNYFTSLIAVSFAAQIGVFPFLLWHFQQVSLVSTLSSLLVIPLLFPLILFSAVSILLPLSWEWMIDIFSEISQTIVELLVELSEMLAGWEFSSQIIVWHPATIILMMLAILLCGLYLEMKQNIVLPWIKYTALSLLSMSFIVEIGNIYHKRTNPVVVIFEYKSQSVTELYYRGICYSNFVNSCPPFLLRIRKKYATRTTIAANVENEWAQLYARLRENTNDTTDQKPKFVQVHDYINGKSFAINLENPFDNGDIPLEKSHLIQVKSKYIKD